MIPFFMFLTFHLIADEEIVSNFLFYNLKEPITLLCSLFKNFIKKIPIRIQTLDLTFSLSNLVKDFKN
jgi:hypothetical protein